MRALSDKNESPATAVLNEIGAVDDVAAIPAFEKVTLNTELSLERKKARLPIRLSFAFSGPCETWRTAGDQFARPIRRALAVWRRPLRSNHRIAIGRLPISYQRCSMRGRPHQVLLSRPNRSGWQRTLSPRGVSRRSFADWSYRSSRSIYQPGSPFGMSANSSAALSHANVVVNATSVPGRAVTNVGAVRSSRSYEQETAAGEQQVQASNQRTAALNERIVAVLTGVSDRP